MQRPLVRRAWNFLALLDYWLTKRLRIFWAARKWDILVCDRYAYDFAVDQALNSGLSPETMVADLGRRIFQWFPRPACTVVLFLSAEEGSRRKQDGTGVGYLQARDAHYQALIQCSGAVGVDASGSIPEVQAAVWEKIRPWIQEAP
jgi:thymidylate kinase